MKTLLAAIDFSDSTDLVIQQASILSKELGARLWILHVASDESQTVGYETTQYSDFSPEFVNLPGDVQLARDLSAEELKREHGELHAISSALREKNIDAHAILLKGTPDKLIIQKAIDMGVQMIILGSHGHGILHKALLGSVSEAVIRHAPCNIMVVPIPEK